jgi:menaquinone-dependent protoporphyrinogen IX oxidase
MKPQHKAYIQKQLMKNGMAPSKLRDGSGKMKLPAFQWKTKQGLTTWFKPLAVVARMKPF